MSISKIKVGSVEHDLHASKLTTARTIALSGDVSGSATFDGSGNVTITTTVADDSHNHIISNVDGLQDALNNKLEKAGYEYNKTLALGSTGYVCIGKFPCYDSNISVEIKSTTNTTYNGTLVIATQNINTSLGGTYTAAVYGDEKKTLADKIKISYLTGSNVFSVYINLPRWSKNILHIQCVALAGSPTDIATTVTEIPSTATIVPTNAFTHKHSVTAAGTVSSTSITPAGTVSQPTFTGTAHNHTFSGSPATSGKPDTTNVTTIYSITNVGSLPSHSYTAPSLTGSVENQCLTLTFNAGSHSFSTGTLPTREAISTPNTNHTHTVTATGTIGSTTAGGTVSQPTFTGTAASHTHTFTGSAVNSSTES